VTSIKIWTADRAESPNDTGALVLAGNLADTMGCEEFSRPDLYVER